MPPIKGFSDVVTADDIKKMRRRFEEELRLVIGSLLEQGDHEKAGRVILALRRELTRWLAPEIKEEGTI